MPITLDRFIRLMSGGLIVTDDLVAVRDGKVKEALAKLKAEVARAKKEDVGFAWLTKTYADLCDARLDALGLSGAKAKCAALELVKNDARTAADEAPKRLDEVLKNVKETRTELFMAEGLCGQWQKILKHGLPKSKDDEGEDAPDLSFLDKPSKEVPQRIKETRTQIKTDAESASDSWKKVNSGFLGVKGQYTTRIVKPRLLKKVNALIKNDPTGPEAQMKEALTNKFESRLVQVAVTSEAFGIDNDVLSPGEQVAVFTYTSNDYADMNKALLGILKPVGDAKKVLDIKCDQAKAALKKLPSYTAGITTRGETEWPGADKQYVLGNEFTIKQFWSSGVGFKFSGKYLISISGKTGKDVAGFSNYPNESEVLFSPGTKFKVIDREDKSEDQVLVTILEV